MAIDKQKGHKSAGTDQTPAEMIKAGDRTICSKIHKLINSLWKKDKLPEERKESITVPIYKKGNKRLYLLWRHITFVNYIQNVIQHPAVIV